MSNETLSHESNKPQNTVTGEVEWSHLFTPDYEYKKTGAWSLGFKTTEEGKAPILAIVREAAGLKSQSENCTDFAKPPFLVADDGAPIVKFTQNAVIEREGKEPIHTKIDVYDAKMNPWPRDIAIGKGSKVKVRYKAGSWNVKAQGGIGVTLRLSAVQVIEHVPYVPSHGFEEEEGVDMGLGSHTPSVPTEPPAVPGAASNDIPLAEAPPLTTQPYENLKDGPVVGGVPF